MFFITGHDRALAQTLRLVDGDPILVQGKWRTDVLKDPRTPEPKDTDNPFYGWVYDAVTPVPHGPRGPGWWRRSWCRPYAARACGQPGRPAPKVTDRPFPGLTVVRDNCQAKDLDTVKQRAAAVGGPR